MKRLLVFFIAATLYLTPTAGQEKNVEKIESLIEEAFANNPDIRSEYFNAEMWSTRVPQAKALDDPQFTYSLMEFPGTKPGEAKFQNFGLMQMIMFPTKLSLKGNIALIDALNAQHGYSEKVLIVVSELKTAYAMLWAARTNLTINKENQHLLNQILQAAQTQYAVGKVTQQDVLRTNIELEKVRTEEALLKQEIVSAESMLRAILNRTSPVVGEVSYPQFSQIPHTLAEVLSFAQPVRPMLIADSLSVEQADYMVSMMKQEYIPDFSVGIERVTMPTGGMHIWNIMASISIPFAPWTLSKASARVQEAMAERSMRKAMLTSSRNMVDAQIRDAHAKVRAYGYQVRAFTQSILPQAEQSLRGLLADYQTGRTSYIMLIDSYRMYQDLRMESTMARMKYEQSLAQLERHTGVTDIMVVPSTFKEEIK